MSMQQVPSVGRIVHYVLREGRSQGECRPALIVRVFDAAPTPDSLVQLQVFTDYTNDGLPLVFWATSVHRADAETKSVGTWHWPEYLPMVDWP